MADYIIGYIASSLVWCTVQMVCFFFIKNAFFKYLPIILVALEFACGMKLGINGIIAWGDALQGVCGIFVAWLIYVIYLNVTEKPEKESINQEESATITEDK